MRLCEDPQRIVGGRQDLHREQARVAPAADRDRRHGDAPGHLHDREQAESSPFQRLALDRDADHGQAACGSQPSPAGGRPLPRRRR